jgi:anti-sigma regulatory factor (Ser/Thr protein kinase)
MNSDGGAFGPGNGFVHQALIYGSDREFMDVAFPFVTEGISADEPILVAVQDRHVENLRAALGGTPTGVTLYAVEQWYETSALTREKFARWADEHADRGRARLIGEPPWAIGHEAQVRDWARHESVINIAFADRRVTFICPYDAQALPGEVLGHAGSTHPKIVDSGGVAESDAYEDPLEFCRRLDAAVRRPGGEPSVELSFGPDGLSAVRRATGSFGRTAGLERTRADDLVLALDEIATNALVHGRSPATLRIWHEDGEVIVEVSDVGDGVRDVFAGQLKPSPNRPGGRGLWLCRLLCDAVEVRNGSGCTVSLHASVPAPARSA